MNELKMLKEPLDIEDIDFRIQSINKGGYATILAYKDARVDMKRLDAVLGPENWQRDHKELKGNIYCGVGIKCGEEWIWKWDCGSESFTEKEKGESSDSFKRACFNWGIGRELYDYPVIQIKLLDNEFDRTNGKPTWDFKLKEWNWISEFDKKGKLIGLAAKDQNKKLRFKFGEFTPKEDNTKKLAEAIDAEVKTK
jgi:hypothetical protein